MRVQKRFTRTAGKSCVIAPSSQIVIETKFLDDSPIFRRYIYGVCAAPDSSSYSSCFTSASAVATQGVPDSFPRARLRQAGCNTSTKMWEELSTPRCAQATCHPFDMCATNGFRIPCRNKSVVVFGRMEECSVRVQVPLRSVRTYSSTRRY